MKHPCHDVPTEGTNINMLFPSTNENYDVMYP